jgi:hypothetical protein
MAPYMEYNSTSNHHRSKDYQAIPAPSLLGIAPYLVGPNAERAKEVVRREV